MAVVKGLGKAPPAKAYAWSYSKLKNYESCPRKHYHIDVAPKGHPDKIVEPMSEQLMWGDQVHKALANALQGLAPLPISMKHFQSWVDRILEGPGQLFVEQQYAITKDFAPTAWFGSDVWFRGIGDVVRIDGPVGLVVDWKTGKVLVDSVQLMLMAQCLFVHYPQLKVVRSEFIWLKDDCSTPEVFTREELADQWVDLMPRVQTLEKAFKTQDYPPLPSGLCKNWCPVLSCEHNGRKK